MQAIGFNFTSPLTQTGLVRTHNPSLLPSKQANIVKQGFKISLQSLPGLGPTDRDTAFIHHAKLAPLGSSHELTRCSFAVNHDMQTHDVRIAGVFYLSAALHTYHNSAFLFAFEIPES